MKKTTDTPNSDAVRRACLPEVMHADDVAVALQIPPSLAHRLIESGRVGHALYVAGRVVVLRDAFIKALADSPDEGHDKKEGGQV
jgi:hypothetical protein